MFAKAGVVHVRIIYFLSSNPWSACLHVGSCDRDCMPDISYFSKGKFFNDLVL